MLAVEKMQMIDEEYEVLRSRGNRWHTFEARLAEYRKEIEEQAQAEINTKVYKTTAPLFTHRAPCYFSLSTIVHLCDVDVGKCIIIFPFITQICKLWIPFC